MKLRGIPVSEGLAVGPIFIYRPSGVAVTEVFCEECQIEENIRRFGEARRIAEEELRAICEKLEADAPERAKIFAAHRDILNDETINEEIMECIRCERRMPDWAVQMVYGNFARVLENAPNPLIRERAADLLDVCARLLRIWHGVPMSSLSDLSEPVVVAAHDLLPSDTATMDRERVLAILTEVGGATSHSAIIARGYEIPAIAGVPELLASVRPGQIAAVDAMEGTAELDPPRRKAAAFANRVRAYQMQAADVKVYLSAPSLTADGTRVEIGLNIASASDEEMEGEPFSDSVGLFRTEFLYMGRGGLPTEDEQFKVYKKVLETYGTRPVTLRTLDIGGDKTLSCMKLPVEDNPFLGVRGLRLCFRRDDVFRTQLRAALRASVFGNLWLMMPMVGSIDDIRRAKGIIEEVKAGLRAEGMPYSADFKTGIMVEIPSIALIADLAAPEVDFASIGTNDLCGYLTASDRMNPDVAQYHQVYHPAMFRLIGEVSRAFGEAGKPVGVCGEMGGDRLAAAAMIGLGVRKFSMGFASVAKMKKMLSTLTIAKAKEMASGAAAMRTAAEAKAFLERELG